MLTHCDARLILLTNYYRSDDQERQKELDYAFNRNAECSCIDLIISIGSDKPLFQHPKLIWHKMPIRPVFQDFIDYCNINFAGEICILANLDITFDETILLVHQVDLTKRMICLTRWENDCLGDWVKNLNGKYGKFHNGAGTQDTWIFKPPLLISDADFTMGYMGCEHKFSKMVRDVGYQVVNPCMSIITTHWHDSGYRTYDRHARLRANSPTDPCYLDELLRS